MGEIEVAIGDFTERKYHVSDCFHWWIKAGSNRRPPACHSDKTRLFNKELEKNT
jgi:hypothetical protein